MKTRIPVILLLSLLVSHPVAPAQDVPVPSGADSKGPVILTVGGGQHHDFERWTHQADSATLGAMGATVSYTEDPDKILPALAKIDVLYLSNNKPIPDPETRKAIFNFVDEGKGLMLVHSSLWYNWRDWPEYNRDLAGGGSRSHPPLGEFEVTVVDGDHPIMEGVPEKFTIVDELYRFEKDDKGPEIHVLAVGKETGTENIFPVVWTVEHPKRRIVCNTLGHDGRAHEHPAFKSLLKNSVRWLVESGK
jgi:type 1 glutamine amidotransferase